MSEYAKIAFIGASALLQALVAKKEKENQIKIEHIKKQQQENEKNNAFENKLVLEKLDQIVEENNVTRENLRQMQEEFEKQTELEKKFLKEMQDRIERENIENHYKIEKAYKNEKQNLIDKQEQIQKNFEIEMENLKQKQEEIERYALLKQEQNNKQSEFECQALFEKQQRLAKRIDRERKKLVEKETKIEKEYIIQQKEIEKYFEIGKRNLHEREKLAKKKIEINQTNLLEKEEAIEKQYKMHRKNLEERLNRYERHNEVKMRMIADIQELLTIECEKETPTSITYNIDYNISGTDLESCLKLIPPLPSLSSSTSSSTAHPLTLPSLSELHLEQQSSRISSIKTNLDNPLKIEHKANVADSSANIISNDEDNEDMIGFEEEVKNLSETQREKLNDEVIQTLTQSRIHPNDSTALPITVNTIKKI